MKNDIKKIVDIESTKYFTTDSQNVSELIKKFASNSWYERKKASRLLVAMGESALPQLKEALLHPNDNIVYWAIKTLGQIKAASKQPLFELLNHDSLKIRIFAVEALLQSNDLSVLRKLFFSISEQAWSVSNTISAGIARLKERAFPILKEAFKSKDENIGYWATVTLGRMGEIALKPLVSFLKSKNKQTRFRAVKALGETRDTKAIPLLLNALSDKHWSIKKLAADSLINFGDNVVEPLIEKLNKENDERIFYWAKYIINTIAKKALPVMINILIKDEGDAPYWVEKLVSSIDDERVVPELSAALLDSPDKEIRAWAAHLLGLFNTEKILNPLIEALKDNNWLVRKNAANSIMNLGEVAIDRLSLAVRDSDENVRFWATRILGRCGENAINPLLRSLKDPNDKIRLFAVNALGESDNPQAVPALISALGDPSWVIRRSAADALIRLEKFAIGTVVKYLNSPNPDIRYWTEKIIEEIGESAIDPLIEILKFSKDREMRFYAAYALSSISHKKAIPALINVLHTDDDVWVRKYSSTALAKLKTPEAKKALFKALDPRTENLSIWIADSIATIGEEIIPETIDLTRHKNPQMRFYAAHILSKMETPEVIHYLISLFKDKNAKVIETAKKGLLNKGEKAIKALIATFSSDEMELKKIASETLIEFGKEAIPILSIASKEDSPNIKTWAKTTLKKLKKLFPD